MEALDWVFHQQGRGEVRFQFGTMCWSLLGGVLLLLIPLHGGSDWRTDWLTRSTHTPRITRSARPYTPLTGTRTGSASPRRPTR